MNQRLHTESKEALFCEIGTRLEASGLFTVGIPTGVEMSLELLVWRGFMNGISIFYPHPADLPTRVRRGFRRELEYPLKRWLATIWINSEGNKQVPNLDHWVVYVYGQSTQLLTEFVVRSIAEMINPAIQVTFELREDAAQYQGFMCPDESELRASRTL